MKPKILITIFAIILLIGIITAGIAAGTISNLSSEISISNFIAGDTTTAEFSFDYLDNFGNLPDSPLVIKVNLSSLDSGYPVGKGDFELTGLIKRYWIYPWIERNTIPLVCSENPLLTINHPKGPTTIEVPKGIFYCYNTYNNLNLDEHDEVILYIKSHQALYPGEYRITAELYSILDLENPIVEILNKNYFINKIFTIDNYFHVTANISDNVGVLSCKGIIENNGDNIEIIGNYYSGKCDFIISNLPNTIKEGIRLFEARAYDTSNNLGSDFMNITIDNSPPTINLISPEEGKVYGIIIPIELNISDKYSEIAPETVQYKIKDLICPDTGVGFGNATCFNSGWISAFYDSASGHYIDNFNSTKEGLLNSGSYWFEARACDVLYDNTIFTNTSIGPRHCVEL